MNNLPMMLAGKKVSCDENGLYSLNDLHKASGGERRHEPYLWLRLPNVKEVISKIEKDNTQICVVSKEGKNGGTWVDRILLGMYASWISPEFHILVYKTFFETMDERFEKLEQEKAQLIEFKDDIYRRGIINGSLPPNTSGTSQRVLKAIQYILNSFTLHREVKYEDVARYSCNHHHYKDFNEAWEYVERNNLLEPRYPNRDRYTNWYKIRIK